MFDAKKLNPFHHLSKLNNLPMPLPRHVRRAPTPAAVRAASDQESSPYISIVEWTFTNGGGGARSAKIKSKASVSEKVHIDDFVAQFKEEQLKPKSKKKS